MVCKTKRHFNKSNIINIEMNIFCRNNLKLLQFHWLKDFMHRYPTHQWWDWPRFFLTRHGMVWFGVLQLYFVTKVILFCTRLWGGEDMSHPQRLLAMSLLGKEFQFPSSESSHCIIQDGRRPPSEARALFPSQWTSRVWFWQQWLILAALLWFQLHWLQHCFEYVVFMPKHFVQEAGRFVCVGIPNGSWVDHGPSNGGA